ncbi:MAG: hypothetical protein GC131_02160 [Alphaproteobacteria bacterium]|nr:hypothetical protein [Alphaproteobacteria bacterium]
MSRPGLIAWYLAKEEAAKSLVARKLPFVKEQPISTAAVMNILGDLCYLLNGLVFGSHILIGGALIAFAAHIIMLANPAKEEERAEEKGFVSSVLKVFRRGARALTLGVKVPNAPKIAYYALAFNGAALAVNAALAVLGGAPALLLPGLMAQFMLGSVIAGGCFSAARSFHHAAQAEGPAGEQRDRHEQKAGQLSTRAARILLGATAANLVSGVLALNPFFVAAACLFFVSGAAVYYMNANPQAVLPAHKPAEAAPK